MQIKIDSNGMIVHAKVRSARSVAIERGNIGTVTGIVVHQTDANTADSSLNSYKNPKANGAHFLIDKDGMIYQTASIMKRTNHVGLLKSRCLAMGLCSRRDYPATGGAAAMHRIEIRKSGTARYPSNMEAIGIELVGRAVLPPGFKPPAVHAKRSAEELRAEYGVYPTPTAAQNQSLAWLVTALEGSLHIASSEVFRHPEVSWKNPTEAQGANWRQTAP